MRTTTILFGLIASAMLPCSSTKMKDVCIHRALEVSTRPGREAIASPTAPLETSLDVLACFLKFLNRGKYWHCALFAAFCRALPPPFVRNPFPIIDLFHISRHWLRAISTRGLWIACYLAMNRIVHYSRCNQSSRSRPRKTHACRVLCRGHSSTNHLGQCWFVANCMSR